MNFENLENDFSSTTLEKDQITQTSASSILNKLPLPKDIHRCPHHKAERADKVCPFEYYKTIHEFDSPMPVKNVRDNLAQEINASSNFTQIFSDSWLDPLLTPRQFDNTESYEIILHKTAKSERREFPDHPLSLEVYNEWKFLNKIKEHFAQSSLINKLDAHTSYSYMDGRQESEDSGSCLTDCSQAEDVNECKQACQDLNEERKNESPKQKPPCGVPVHRSPKCEKPPNCKPKVKTICKKGSTSSECDAQPDIVIITDLKENEDMIDTKEKIIEHESIQKEKGTEKVHVKSVSSVDSINNLEENELNSTCIERNIDDIKKSMPNISVKSNSEDIICSDLKNNSELNYTNVENKVDNIIKNSSPNISLKSNSSEVVFADLKNNVNLNDTETEQNEIGLIENISPNNPLKSSDVKSTDSKENVKLNNAQIEEKIENLENPISNILLENHSSSQKSFAENHDRAMSTIKLAMEDFFGIFRRKTQDTVSLIATESVKALKNIRVSEAASTDIQAKEKNVEINGTDTIKKVSFFQKTDDSDDNKGKEIIGKKVKEVVGGLITKVGSSMTIFQKNKENSDDNNDKESFLAPKVKTVISGLMAKVSSSIFEKEKDNSDKNTNKEPVTKIKEVVDSMLTKVNSSVTSLGAKLSEGVQDLVNKRSDFNNSSSPFDQPKKNNEKPAHVFTPEPETGVFSSIKSKIYSYFSDKNSSSPSFSSSAASDEYFTDDKDEED